MTEHDTTAKPATTGRHNETEIETLHPDDQGEPLIAILMGACVFGKIGDYGNPTEVVTLPRALRPEELMKGTSPDVERSGRACADKQEASPD